jgi:hypothetical protein
MSSPQLEAFLARLYTDEALRAAFLGCPEAVARGAGLAEREAAALAMIDRDGLVIAARSFRAKRAARGERGWRWLMAKAGARRHRHVGDIPDRGLG